MFAPLIIYSFVKAAFIALGNGHGLIQASGQLAAEILLLVLLVWSRPFNTKAGNILNIIISVVRVLSVVCLLIFSNELQIAADTKTVCNLLTRVEQSLTSLGHGCCSHRNTIGTDCSPRCSVGYQCHCRNVQG